MLPPTIQRPESVLKVLRAKKAFGVGSNCARMEQEYSPTSKTNANKLHQEIGCTSRRSKFKSHFSKQHSDTNFRSLNRSGSGGSCGSGLLIGNRANIPTRNIVNRALEVMSKSLKDADYTPRQPVKSVDDVDTADESEKDQTPSDSSNSDNDNDAPAAPTSRLGNITAQLSFRKIAKKRRKAGGRTSFHHTKSSKEYLRKAQEAYQRLKISEQEKQNDQHCQRQSEKNSDGIEKHKNPCKHVASDNSSRMKTRESEVIDYGYGDPADTRPKDAVDYGYGGPVVSEPQQRVEYGYGNTLVTEPQQKVDYGYGDSAVSEPQQKVNYGYGDSACDQSQHLRRGGRARRRNSVTKFSIEAANVVAAQAAAERILQLKPSLTSLSRNVATTPTRRRRVQDQPQRLNTKQNRGLTSRRIGGIAAMQTTLQIQHNQQQEKDEQKKNSIDNMFVDRLEPPRRPSRHPRVCGDRGSIMKHSSHLQEQAESKQSKHDNSSSLQTFSSTANPHFQLTSDYFSPDPKPKNLVRRNSGILNGTTFRFSTPARTSSWLSHDNSFSTVNQDDDDDDADSLASDMESLCSIRDSNYRLDTHHTAHTLKKMDTPPVLPTPPLDRRTRFTGGRSCSGDLNPRKSLVVSWSNGSNKIAVDKSRTSRDRRSSSNEFPILPHLSVTTTNGLTSNSCMPAPVNRTPSFKISQQRQD